MNLTDEEPISRQTLCSEAAVTAAKQEAYEDPQLGETPYDVWLLLTQEYETDGSIFLSDVLAALDEFTGKRFSPSQMSRAMKDRIRSGPQ